MCGTLLTTQARDYVGVAPHGFIVQSPTKKKLIIYSRLMRQVNAVFIHGIKLTVPNFFALELNKQKIYDFPVDKV